MLFAASTLLLMACDASSLVKQVAGQAAQQAQQAVETAAPTLQAAATAVAPSELTQAPASSSSTGNPLLDALTKAKGATKYRVDFSMIVGQTQNGKYQESPFIDLKGEVDGTNSHFTSQGALLAIMSTDTNATLEIIEAGGKTYMKGVNMFGMTDPKQWYITDNNSTSSFADFAKPDFYSDFTSGQNFTDFNKVRTESLDGKSCDVYLYDLKSLSNSALVGLLGMSQDQGAFTAIDKGEVDVWLCDDGFVHKYVLDYEGHDSKNPIDKGAVKVNGHLWDYGNPAITVQAPANAKPMPGSK